MEEKSSRQPLDLRARILTRREALIGAGVLAGGMTLAGVLAACGTTTSTTTTSGTPKRGGNFRLGVTGGGAKDIIDGQNIVTKPDQARLVAGFETLLVYDENYNLMGRLKPGATMAEAQADISVIAARIRPSLNGMPGG